MDQQRVAILGAGSWGSALAHLLGTKGYAVRLWDRDAELMEDIRARGLNPKYLPDVALPPQVSAVPAMRDALAEADWVIVAVSSGGVREVVAEAADFLLPSTAILSATKGLEAETGFTVSEVIITLLADVSYHGLAVLSGPNLARELILRSDQRQRSRGDPNVPDKVRRFATPNRRSRKRVRGAASP